MRYDDPYWLTLHYKQWRAYAEHYKLDQEELADGKMAFAEYIMSFHNIDGVKAVQRARETQRLNTDSGLGEVFTQQVEQLFGRRLDFNEMMEERSKAGADQSVYSPAVETPKQRSARDRVKEQADTIVVKKAPKQPSDARIEIDSQRMRRVPKKD